MKIYIIPKTDIVLFNIGESVMSFPLADSKAQVAPERSSREVSPSGL